MVTIKNVAALANVSASTASIVLKGNGDQKKITKETQEKVLRAAKELGYTPNLQAKLLRSGAHSTACITLFWALDFRINILSRFLMGLQDALIANGYPCEIQIKPYKNNFLRDALSERTLLSCNGIIICNASEKDLDYLENAELNIPVVLYNRYSKKYATVNMDDRMIGTIPADVFSRHGKTRPVVLKAPPVFDGMNIRTNVFEAKVIEYGMQLPTSIMVENTMKGGYDGAKRIISLAPLPDCVFCTSGDIALGALKAFHDNGIKVPDQIEVIGLGTGSSDQQEYSIPSLSVVNLPMEEMAAACIKKLYESLTNYSEKITSVEYPVHYIGRESCPL